MKLSNRFKLFLFHQITCRLFYLKVSWLKLFGRRAQA